MEINTQTVATAIDRSHQNVSNGQKVKFQRVLVALDYSFPNREIFDQGVDLAKNHQADLMICHCLQTQSANPSELFSLGMMGGTYSADILDLEEQIIEENTTELQECFNSLQQEARQEGIKTEFHYLAGNPGEEICDLAHIWQADVIVIGRRGLSGFSEMLFGSVSNYVFHHAQCAVLVVQNEEQEAKKDAN